MNALEKSQHIAVKKYSTCIHQMSRKLATQNKNIFKNLKKDGGDPIKRLHKLYAFMAQLSEHVNKYTPCHKGCSNCCYIPISITELDVQYIERSLFIRRKTETSVILPTTRCPFLVSNSCSIYKYRPFVCRKNVTFDQTSKWCHVEVGANAPMPTLQFYKVEEAYNHIVHISGASKIFDIRDVFQMQSF